MLPPPPRNWSRIESAYGTNYLTDVVVVERSFPSHYDNGSSSFRGNVNIITMLRNREQTGVPIVTGDVGQQNVKRRASTGTISVTVQQESKTAHLMRSVDKN